MTQLLEEHYDPAYRRSASRNFPRLADAEPSLTIASADASAFEQLARTLFGSRKRDGGTAAAVPLGA